MERDRRPNRRDQECDEPFALGYVLARIETNLKLVLRKVNLLLKQASSGDLSPEAKAAFQAEVDRLEDLAPDNPPDEPSKEK